MANAKRADSQLELSGFTHGYYLISATTDKFDFEHFASSLTKLGHSDAIGKDIAFFGAEDVDLSPYYVVASWFTDENDINFRIEYALGVMPRAKGELGPHAEHFMEWFGQFFKYNTAQSHMHAYFEHTLKTRQSRYPLPIKTSLPGDTEPFEIFGITLRIPSKPSGVTSLRLTKGKTHWFTEVIANRRIAFRGFALNDDASALAAVVETFLEGKQ